MQFHDKDAMAGRRGGYDDIFMTKEPQLAENDAKLIAGKT